MARGGVGAGALVVVVVLSLGVAARAESGSSAESGASQRGFLTRTNHDLEGGDLSRFQGATQDACERACSDTDDCVAYSYDKWNRWCFLKSSLGLLRAEPKCVVGISRGVGEPQRASTAKIMQRYRGKIFPGEAYARRKSGGFEGCEDTCRRETACVAFSFMKSDQSCKLFDDAPEYQSNEEADSGVKRQPEGG